MPQEGEADMSLCHAGRWIMHRQTLKINPSSAARAASSLTAVWSFSNTGHSEKKIKKIKKYTNSTFPCPLCWVWLDVQRKDIHSNVARVCEPAGDGANIFPLTEPHVVLDSWGSNFSSWIFIVTGSNSPWKAWLPHRLSAADWSEMLTDSGVWFGSCYL